jgi:hypothetical protein
MITIYAKLDCGCCTTELRFLDEEAAVRAFAGAGLGNGMTITDDAGVTHTGLDTFYGFSTSEEDQETRSIGFLVSQVLGR